MVLVALGREIRNYEIVINLLSTKKQLSPHRYPCHRCTNAQCNTHDNIKHARKSIRLLK